MRIKSYFAKTVDEAMVQARAELGNDALLLNTRKGSGQAGKPDNYEVVFGTVDSKGDEPVEATGQVTAPPSIPLAVPERRQPEKERRDSPEEKRAPLEHRAVKAEAAAPPRADLSVELERLNAQMDEIRALIMRSAGSRVSVGRSVPELADVYARLMTAEVDPALSKDIIDRLEASMATDAFFLRAPDGRENGANRWKSLRLDPARLEVFVQAELERRAPIMPRLGSEGKSGGVVALVGPTGAGKTTTLMKLATSDVVAGRTLRVLSLDTSRIAGQMQLQSFASNLGITFATVASIHALPAMVADASKKDLVLIDTPGYSGNDSRSAELAAGVLARCPGIDVHLVAPGYMKGADLRRCIQRYQMFAPAKLLVTKLDETQTFGSAFSEAAYAGLAISFLTTGPAVPEDIRAASVEDLLSMALDREQIRAQCA
jgi:flagellar biosynthesis protein FlhF